MANKIVFIQGAPRKKGNTRAAAKITMEAAREQGAEVTEIDVTTLSFKEPGCTGCYKCQNSDEYKCALNDEVAEKVATLPGYDVIVLATPLYWWSYTAQLKIFIDRMYSLMKFSGEGHKSAIAGKAMGLLATAGGPYENNLELLETQWKNPADMLGCKFMTCLFPETGPDEGSLRNDPSSVEKAKEFGILLATA
ncbi:MAG: flavodoxin family protein [Deltaproteobacteria bacterium]|nr:flavodoxin family protein [Deltaproteobacteria bacterium]